jgi:hypothetical protein
VKITILVAFVLTFFIADAYAYLDPGTGSMLLQVLIAGILAIGVFWRKLKAWIKDLFKSIKEKTKN